MVHCNETSLCPAFQVPLDYVPASASSRHFLVGVGGLISYQHMGSMELKCSGGCTCPALHHDMFHSQAGPFP